MNAGEIKSFMDLAKLDKQILWATITLAAIDIGMVVVGVTIREFYDVLRLPIIAISIVSLTACYTGYKVNKKYREQPD